MGRKPGSRNKSFEETRASLLDAITSHLISASGDPATLKELSSIAGVSPPTIRHYFGDLEGVYKAAFEHALERGEPYIREQEAAQAQSAHHALWAFLEVMIQGWSMLGPVLASMLRLGLRHPERGPMFLENMLEPSLQTCERLIEELVEAGELVETDITARALALTIVSPVLLALLHQHELGGEQCRALDVSAFASTHLDLVLKGLST